jgi:hypothetical protein
MMLITPTSERKTDLKRSGRTTRLGLTKNIVVADIQQPADQVETNAIGQVRAVDGACEFVKQLRCLIYIIRSHDLHDERGTNAPQENDFAPIPPQKRPG